MVGVEVDEAKCPFGPGAQGLQHLVICLAQLSGRRILHAQGYSQREDKSLHTEPVCIIDELAHALLWRFPGNAREMEMHIPDQGLAGKRRCAWTGLRGKPKR